MKRGYFYCHTSRGGLLTAPTAISTEDLSGNDAGQNGVWSCVEVPIEQISRDGSKIVNWLDRLGFELL